jgi:hypothetical protein
MSTDDPARHRIPPAGAPSRDIPLRAELLALRIRVAALEAELERERRRRRGVIEQYERLLDERGLDDRSDGDNEDGDVWDGDIFSLLLD